MRNLFGNNARADRLDGTDAGRVLAGDGGDGAGAKDAERLKSFQVGLNTGAAAAIGAGDRESDRHRHAFLHAGSINGTSRRGNAEF